MINGTIHNGKRNSIGHRHHSMGHKQQSMDKKLFDQIYGEVIQSYMQQMSYEQTDVIQWTESYQVEKRSEGRI